MLKIKYYHVFFLAWFPFHVLGVSKIEHINNLSPIIDFIDCTVTSGYSKTKFRKILFVFHLDDVLINTEDLSLNHFYWGRTSAILSGLCRDLGITEKESELKKNIAQQAGIYLLDPQASNLMNMIKTNEFRAIAMSSSFGGVLSSYEDIFVDKLRSLGLDFKVSSNLFNPVKNVFCGNMSMPLFKSGILFYRPYSKCVELVNFLNEVKRKIGWVPEMLIFVGDRYDDIVSLGEAIENLLGVKQSIDFWGLKYSIQRFNGYFDNLVVAFQFQNFLKTGIWLDYFEAKKIMCLVKKKNERWKRRRYYSGRRPTHPSQR